MTLLSLCIYLFVQLCICIYISRRIKNEADYLVGGRRFGVLVVSVSLFATWFGAETCIGSSAAVFDSGLSGSRADPFGYSLCLFLSGILIAGKIWNRKYITLSDFYRDRFGKKVEVLAVWVLALSSLIWAAAQLRAFGQVVSSTTNLPIDTTLFIAFLFVLGYTLLGGLMGDMITDVIQACVIVTGLVILLVSVWINTPEIPSIISDLSASKLSMIAPDESWWQRLDRWAIPIFGSLVAQEIISRIFSARSKSIAVSSCYISGIIYLAIGAIPIFLGLIGPSLITIEGESSEKFLILLANKYLSPVMVGVFSGAIISALLATIDSILLSSSALFSHNLLVPAFKIQDEKKKLLISRLVVIASGVVAYALAVRATNIYDLLEEASSFGTAGILVITLIGLWSKFGDAKAALMALVTGLLSTPIADHYLKFESPFLFSIGASLVIYVAIGLWSMLRLNLKQA